jgi:hypothetical protein
MLLTTVCGKNVRSSSDGNCDPSYPRVILRGAKPRPFVMIEKNTVRLLDCIPVMMGLTKSIGEIVRCNSG